MLTHPTDADILEIVQLITDAFHRRDDVMLAEALRCLAAMMNRRNQDTGHE
ncbi:MAG: hypothetical protein R3D03_10210 [Geminicoccaceae bacterium]